MSNKIPLNKEWKMQSSEKLSKPGEVISTTVFVPEDWYTIDVPTTVINGLLVNNEFEFSDPYFGLNLKSLPGYKTDVKRPNYESRYKPEDSPYRKSWWFRKEFSLEDNQVKKESWLAFDGINYSANVWLNGKRIAGSDYVIGAYRQYRFHVTRFVTSGKNVLALEVFSPNPDDLGISFVDWNPLPPDDNMGIWQPVYLYTTGSVALKFPFVRSILNIETLKEAELIITTELHNTQKEHIMCVVEGKIESMFFQKEVSLNPHEKKIIEFSSEEFPQLRINNPRVWWPYQLGSPELYKLDLKVIIDNKYSDWDEIIFGIREIKSYINEFTSRKLTIKNREVVKSDKMVGSRVFTINGHDVLLRGAGWTPNMMLNQSDEQDHIDVSFLRNLNMNTVRFEGKLATDNFWDVCDREGILVLAGWVCCSHWEKWDNWKAGDIKVAEESLRSQILRLRNHPSFTAWFYGSDFPPPEQIERVYLKVLEETYNQLPRISSATSYPTKLAGETGVKMTGPYTYVPPSYWYTEGRIGAAEKFNTETGPDVCIPPYESLKRMLPESQLYIGSEGWNYHAGLGAFASTRLIEDVITQRYGEPKDFEDFIKTAQILGYECWRAMYEAHARNFPKATGCIGWMLNSAWPSLIWQLYDFYLNPNGAFFGSKKACETLHVQYSYDDASIWVINTTLNKKENLTITARVYNITLDEIYHHSKKVNLKANSKSKVLIIPELNKLSSVYFLHLIIEENSNVVNRNFYWFSKKKDILEEEDKWPYTPLKSHADMSAIRYLPSAEVESSFGIKESEKNFEITITLENISPNLAFFLRLIILDEKTKQFVTPVYWDDNCVSLLPSEKVEIKGIFPKKAISGRTMLKVDGWNC
ncbi:MAG: sugar-binding domain-containing protein [Candidatus Hodarchaeota archaeon]